MDSERLLELLEKVHRGTVSVSQAVARLRHMPFEDLGFAKLDHHRALRQGFPEVILGEGKRASEIAAIVRSMRQRKLSVLVTRLDPTKMNRLRGTGLRYHRLARAATWSAKRIPVGGKGTILVVCA